jgi:hypothetical protein
MKIFDSTYRPRARGASLGAGIALVAALYTGGGTIALAASLSSANVQAEKNIDALALRWFAQMQAGEIDRAQLTPDYNARLTNDAVREMSQYLKEHNYGVPPGRAEVVQTRTSGDQTLYVVKLVFPRGDAASLLFGFNTEGKITGISLLSMAGD